MNKTPSTLVFQRDREYWAVQILAAGARILVFLDLVRLPVLAAYILYFATTFGLSHCVDEPLDNNISRRFEGGASLAEAALKRRQHRIIGQLIVLGAILPPAADNNAPSRGMTFEPLVDASKFPALDDRSDSDLLEQGKV